MGIAWLCRPLITNLPTENETIKMYSITLVTMTSELKTGLKTKVCDTPFLWVLILCCDVTLTLINRWVNKEQKEAILTKFFCF